MSITKKSFGFKDGKEVFLYTLKNELGTTLDITTYGGALVRIITKDKDENFRDVILGYDSLEGYINGTSHQGALVGRFANRISGGRFTLDGVEYTLDKNDHGVNCLHGGNTGYNTRVWDVLYTADGKEPSLSLTYVDPDGTENFPGTVKVNVIYTLTRDNSVKIEYYAETDKPTVINLPNHTYFNLNGYDSGDILSHEVQIFADYFTPANKDLVPTGEIRSVKGTPLDFTSPKPLARDLYSDYEQMIIGSGYDHNFITGDAGKMKHIAVVTAESGIIMNVYSDEPAVQLYIGNFLNGETGKNSSKLNKRCGLCLETQYYPDSPNHPEFPSCVLRPGETYHFTTVYNFSHK